MNAAAASSSAPTYPRRWFANPLLCHDFAIASVLLRDLFMQWRNAVIIAALAAFGIALLRNFLLDLPEHIRNLVLFGFSSCVAMLCDLSLRSRTRYFRRDSPLAPAALAGINSITYRVTMHLILSVTTALLLCLPDLRLSMQVLASWWISLALVAVAATIGVAGQRIGLGKYFGWLIAALRSRRVGGGFRSITVVTSLLIVIAPYWLSYQAVPFQSAGLTLVILSWYSPVDHAIINFERIAGQKPSASVWAVLRRPVKMAVLFLTAALVSLDLRSAAAVFAVVMAVLMYRFLTIMLSRVVRPRQVEFAMFVLLGLTLSIAFPVPFLAPLPIIVMFAWLNRNATKRLWLLQ